MFQYYALKYRSFPTRTKEYIWKISRNESNRTANKIPFVPLHLLGQKTCNPKDHPPLSRLTGKLTRAIKPAPFPVDFHRPSKYQDEKRRKEPRSSFEWARKLNEDVVTVHIRNDDGSQFSNGNREKSKICSSEGIMTGARKNVMGWRTLGSWDRTVFHYGAAGRQRSENAKQLGTTGRRLYSARGNIVRRECSWRYCASTATTRLWVEWVERWEEIEWGREDGRTEREKRGKWKEETDGSGEGREEGQEKEGKKGFGGREKRMRGTGWGARRFRRAT